MTDARAKYWLPKGTLVERSGGAGWKDVRTTLDAYYTELDIEGIDQDSERLIIALPKGRRWTRMRVAYRDLIPAELYPRCDMCGRTYQHYSPDPVFCPECQEDNKESTIDKEKIKELANKMAAVPSRRSGKTQLIKDVLDDMEAFHGVKLVTSNYVPKGKVFLINDPTVSNKVAVVGTDSQ